MKKTIKLLSLMLVVILMSGCVKCDVGMTIGDDSSGTIEVTSAISKSMMDSLSGSGATTTESEDEDESQAMKDKGFEEKEYNEGDWQGVTYSKKYKNIDDLSTDKPVTVNLNDLIDSEKEEVTTYFQKKSSLFKTTYVANFTIDLSSEEEGMDSSSLQSFASSMEFNYHVSLPVKAGTNNATKVSDDEKVLTWDLEYGKINEVKYEFSKVNVMAYVIVGVVALLVLIVVVYFIVNSMKKKKNNNVNGAAPQPMTAGPMPNQPVNDPVPPMVNNAVDSQPGNDLGANVGDVSQPVGQPMEADNNTFVQPPMPSEPEPMVPPVAPTEPQEPVGPSVSLENQPPIISTPTESPAPVEQPQENKDNNVQ